MEYIGYAILAIVAIFVLLIVVAAIKAVKIKAKPNTNAPAINPTEDEANDYAHKLSEMVKVPTISLRGNTDKIILVRCARSDDFRRRKQYDYQ